MVIKDTLMAKLYELQFEHWNKRLTIVSQKNAICYNRDTDKYAIFYRNKKWRQQGMYWFDNEDNALCLPVHPDFPDIAQEMEIIATEFDEIIEEKYEVERFLSGLFLFLAPPEVFKKVLGVALYSACSEELSKHGMHVEMHMDDIEWNSNAEDSLEVYLKDKSYIITAMNERLMMNLITPTT